MWLLRYILPVAITLALYVAAGLQWWSDAYAETAEAIGATLRAHAQIPARAHRYHRLLAREAQRVFGLDAPVARLAGQIHQESSWHPDAKGPYAEGLAQFTPDTAVWIASLYPAELSAVDAYSPKWAIRALAHYDLYLVSRVKPWRARDVPACDRWAFALVGYVGGPRWVTRDRRLAADNNADPDRWFGHVEQYTRRSEWAREQSRDYPRRVLLLWEPVYASAGWGGEPICP